jgi:Flp pilus assembly protein TadG
MALAIPILVILVVGLIEFGFGFLDFQVVSGATREGARVGSALGNAPNADQLIIDAVEEALSGMRENSEPQEIWIFKSDSNGNVVDEVNTTNKYKPNALGAWVCDVPCPWDEATRSVTLNDSLTTVTRDYLGVRVIFEHEWVVGLFPFSAPIWVDDTVMQLEPDLGS